MRATSGRAFDAHSMHSTPARGAPTASKQALTRVGVMA